MRRKGKIGIVVPALSEVGGVPAVALFLHRVISESRDLTSEFISMAVSSRDPASVRLLSPSSWFTGPRVLTEYWQGFTFQHVGCRFAELEFQRYLPRKALTDVLNQFDLIQVVAGAPMAGLAVGWIPKPKCINVATNIRCDRKTVSDASRGVQRAWYRAMTEVDHLIELIALERMDHVFVQSTYTRQLFDAVVA